MSELSIHELEMEHGALLPEREALGVFGSFNKAIFAENSATAVQALTLLSSNEASANQLIFS